MRLFAVIVFLSLLIPLVCSESEIEDESCKYTRKTTIHKMILSVTLSAKGACKTSLLLHVPSFLRSVLYFDYKYIDFASLRP